MMANWMICDYKMKITQLVWHLRLVLQDMDGASSNEVADKTNWGNLADYLKIERGVDDQGVNLLKRVYDQYDSDHNWRPKNPKCDRC